MVALGFLQLLLSSEAIIYNIWKGIFNTYFHWTNDFLKAKLKLLFVLTVPISLFLKELPYTDLHAGVVNKWTYQWELSLAAYKQYKSCCTLLSNSWPNKVTSEFPPAFAISHATSSSKCYHTHGKSPSTYAMACAVALRAGWTLLCGRFLATSEGQRNPTVSLSKGKWKHLIRSLSSSIACLQHIDMWNIFQSKF